MALWDDAVQGFTFNEASGNIIDVIGSNDLTATGISYGETGILGDAIGFIRADQDSVIGTSAVSGDSTWTVMGWVKSTTTSNEQFAAIVNHTGILNSGVGCGIDGSDRFRVVIAGVAWGDGTEDITDGSWHSYMLTKNSNVYNLYTDGGAGVISTITNAGGTFGTGFAISPAYNATTGWDGEIDEHVVFSSIKSTADFAAFHNSGSGEAIPTIVDVAPSTLTLSLTQETTTPIIKPIADSLSLSLSIIAPGFDIMDNTNLNPNRGTVSTKEISKSSIPAGIGDVTNLVPESSTVLSKTRVGLEL